MQGGKSSIGGYIEPPERAKRQISGDRYERIRRTVEFVSLSDF